MVQPEVRLRHDGGEERGVSAETVLVDGGAGVVIHAACEQPLRDLHLVVVDGHMEQRRALERRAVRRQYLIVAAELRRVDLLVAEGATVQGGIAA